MAAHEHSTGSTPDAECVAAPAARAPAPATPADAAPSVASHAAAAQDDAALRQDPFGRANPHFEMLGGAPAVRALVDRFYAHMDTRPEAAGIRAMHGADLAPVKDTLVRFLTEWLGGPQLYSATRGQPRLRRKHLPFSIGARERDAWMDCMTRALDDVCIDETLKKQLTQAFFKTADFIRNDQGNSHEHSHGNQTHLPAGPPR